MTKSASRIEGRDYPGFRGLVHCTLTVILRPAKLLFVNDLAVVVECLQEVVPSVPQFVVRRDRYIGPELCDFSREAVGRFVGSASSAMPPASGVFGDTLILFIEIGAGDVLSPLQADVAA